MRYINLRLTYLLTYLLISRVAAHTHCQTELSSMIGRLAVWWTRQLIIDLGPGGLQSMIICRVHDTASWLIISVNSVSLALRVGGDLRQCTLLVKSKGRLHYLLLIAASDLPLRTIKFCSVVFRITLRLLVINTSSSSPVNNKRRRLFLYQRWVSPSCHDPAQLCV